MILLAAVGAFVAGMVGTLVSTWLQQRGWHAMLAAGAASALAEVILYPWPRPVPEYDVPVWLWLRAAMGAVVVGVSVLVATIAGITAFEELRDQTLFDPQAVARTFDGVDLTEPLVGWVKDEVEPIPILNGNGPPPGSNGPNGTLPVLVQLGMPQATAESFLRTAGFQVRVEQVPSDQPAGRVVDSSPAPGTHAPQGSTVTIYVSTGPPAG